MTYRNDIIIAFTHKRKEQSHTLIHFVGFVLFHISQFCAKQTTIARCSHQTNNGISAALWLLQNDLMGQIHPHCHQCILWQRKENRSDFASHRKSSAISNEPPVLSVERRTSECYYNVDVDWGSLYNNCTIGKQIVQSESKWNRNFPCRRHSDRESHHTESRIQSELFICLHLRDALLLLSIIYYYQSVIGNGLSIFVRQTDCIYPVTWDWHQTWCVCVCTFLFIFCRH